MSDKIITLKDKDSNNLYPTSSYNAIKDPNGYVLPSDFTKFDLVNSSGTGWIKYENGMMICWGTEDWTSRNNGYVTVSYPTPFLSGTTPIVVAIAKSPNRQSSASSPATLYGSDITNVHFTCTVYGVGSGDRNDGLHYIAIGYWK